MHRGREQGRSWAIILAGGDGTRLACLTEALHARPVPKQFAVIAGRESLLQSTLRRVARIVPARRTLVVLGRSHLAWARAQLGTRRGISLLAQPSSLGTAGALLYALSWIRQRDARAHVLMFPSDHFVASLHPFLSAVRDAERVSRETGRLTLLGVAPDVSDPDYGWIVPGSPLPGAAGPAREVHAFVEKPDPEFAARLHAEGALWNTFILAAPAGELWRLADRHLPVHAAAFDALDRFSFCIGAPDIEELYLRLPPADLSREVLQLAGRLAVVPMAGTGWCDWGTPERVLGSLQGTPVEAAIRTMLDARTLAAGETVAPVWHIPREPPVRTPHADPAPASGKDETGAPRNAGVAIAGVARPGSTISRLALPGPDGRAECRGLVGLRTFATRGPATVRDSSGHK